MTQTELVHSEMRASRSPLEISDYANRLGVTTIALEDETGCGIVGVPISTVWISEQMSRITPFAGKSRDTTVLNVFLIYLIYEIGLPFSEMTKGTGQGSDTGIPIFDELEESYFYLATKAMSAAIGVAWLDSMGVSRKCYGSYYKCLKGQVNVSIGLFHLPSNSGK